MRRRSAMEAEFAWQLPPDHPVFSGHFPGRPIVPGVVLLDRSILFAEQLLGAGARRWQVAQAKFHSPAGPGQMLNFSFQLRPSGAIAFTGRHAGRPVAAGSLVPSPA
jgi:3-hydroxyacyl-[acyl-carrier-protein] dehydratase